MLDDVSPANIASMQAVAKQLAGGADFARAIASL